MAATHSTVGRRRSTKRSGDLTQRQAEAIFKKLTSSPAQMTKAQTEEIERALLKPENHAYRRVAFAILAMSGQELVTKIEADFDSAVMFADMAKGIYEYLDRTRAVVEAIESAEVRIRI